MIWMNLVALRMREMAVRREAAELMVRWQEPLLLLIGCCTCLRRLVLSKACNCTALQQLLILVLQEALDSKGRLQVQGQAIGSVLLLDLADRFRLAMLCCRDPSTFWALPRDGEKTNPI